MDETLRDGIQSPSVVDPRIEDKILFTEIANDLGIHHIDIGLPGAGPRAVADCSTLAAFIRDHRLAIKPACAARTHIKDVQAVIDVSQAVGIEIEVMAFIGSSPIRQYAEDWDLDLILSGRPKRSISPTATDSPSPTSPRTPRARAPTSSTSCSATPSITARIASACATPSVTRRRTASRTSSSSPATCSTGWDDETSASTGTATTTAGSGW
jgi:hypothetical protein